MAASTTLVGCVSCLDDSTVVRLLAGRLDDAARYRVEMELGRCQRCGALVAEVVRGSSVIRTEPGAALLRPIESTSVDPAESDHGSSRYVLGAEIARGGMGAVFGAFDRQLSRSIAIKRLGGDDPAFAARF